MLASLASVMPAQPSAATRTQGDLQGLELFRAISQVALDPQRVYKIRDAALDREDIHFNFNDGTIAFAQQVNGHITGALFIGEGELLLVPPDLTERESLAQFTGLAVLSERFSLAYFRFSDDAFYRDLQPYLRPPDAPEEFLTKAKPLFEGGSNAEALWLLQSLTREKQPQGKAKVFIRARLNGEHLGLFDVSFNTAAGEQISAGQAVYSERGRFFNLWCAFPMRSARQQRAESHAEGAGAEENSDSVRVLQYRIDAQVKPPSDISAEAEMTVHVNEGGDRTVIFELSRFLRVSAISMQQGDESPEKLSFIQNSMLQGSELARRGNDFVAVLFPRPLRNGERLKLRMAYAGPVMAEAGGGLMYVGSRGAWYPSRGLWTSNFDLTFRSPPGWKLLATGRRVSQESTPEGEVTRWVSEQPTPLAGFNLGQYETSSVKVGRMVVESYAARAMESAFPREKVVVPTLRVPSPRMKMGQEVVTLESPDPAKNAQLVADHAADTISFLQPRLGPYPYSSLRLTQMPGHSSQGWPGLIFLSSYAFLTPAQRARVNIQGAEEIYYDRLMEAHETAHQWWGDSVMWRSYRDQWLMEALANYCALLQLESVDKKSFDSLMENYRRELLAKNAGGEPMLDAGPVTLGSRLNSSKYQQGYEVVTYGRGTWLIHMLREMLRDSSQSTAKIKKAAGGDFGPDTLFFQVLQQLQQKFRAREMSTHDFLQAFEAVLPASLRYEGQPSLDWFFDGWVDGTALPSYEIKDLKVRNGAGSRRSATFRLLQDNAPNSLVTSVPIYADLGAGRSVFVRRVFADGAETELKLEVPAGTRKLLVDPYDTVLKRQ